MYWRRLFAFDRSIYVTDKEQGGTEADGPEHEEEAIADAGHVPVKERGLHETRHVRPCIVVVPTVTVNE